MRVSSLAISLCAAVVATPVCADELRTVSARADMVSGGDVLVAATFLRGEGEGDARVDDWRDRYRITRNGADVSSSFAPDGSDGVSGVVDGLSVGRNVLVLEDKQNRVALDTIEVVNHPSSGPIFSGPHELPFFCGTERSGLGEPLDQDCSIATRFEYLYRSTDGEFKPLEDPSSRPEDLANATIYGGRSVPYIVRMETGTINRAIYRIAIIDDPLARSSGEAWAPGEGWNGKLQYSFGGGCGSGRRQGVSSTRFFLNDQALSRGFAIATSTLNTYGTACNDVLSAESVMMVKEHFAENYGVPRYTVGQGGSGGAMQQHLVAQNYPGLLDGIVPERSFPDGQTLTHTPSDASLLVNYFDNPSVSWSDSAKLAVSGFGRLATLMDRWSVVGDRNSVWPSMCADDIPEEVRYDATENPAGVRCTIFESMARFYGRDLDTGFALRALDNVGVQYGLGALNDGQITPEQFVDLNERIGGYDLDGQFVGDRTVGDVEAIRAGYRTGRVINGAGMDLPIIDLRVYMDDNGSRGVPDSGDVHTRFHSLEMRQRLINANGNAENQVIWIASPDEMSNGNLVASDAALDLMDDWLEALLADNSGATYRERVLRARPAELNDGCWDRDGAWISDSDVFNPESRCNTIYP